MIQQQIDELIGNTNVGIAVCNKEGYELIELEEGVKNDHGCWIRFMKTPIITGEPETAATKKAPAKGAKTVAPTDELKPVFGKTWISLADFNKVGAIETKQRVYL